MFIPAVLQNSSKTLLLQQLFRLFSISLRCYRLIPTNLVSLPLISKKKLYIIFKDNKYFNCTFSFQQSYYCNYINIEAKLIIADN